MLSDVLITSKYASYFGEICVSFTEQEQAVVYIAMLSEFYRETFFAARQIWFCFLQMGKKTGRCCQSGAAESSPVRSDNPAQRADWSACSAVLCSGGGRKVMQCSFISER